MRRPVSEFWPTFWAWLLPACVVVAVFILAGNWLLRPVPPTHADRIWDKDTAEAVFVGDTPPQVVRKLGPDFVEYFDRNSGQTTGMRYSPAKLKINGKEMVGGLMIHFGRGGRCWAAELLPPPTR